MRTHSLFLIAMLGLVLASGLTGCAGRREPGYADRDGTTALTRDREPSSNYGTSNSTLDQQADDGKIDLFKHKKSF